MARFHSSISRKLFFILVFSCLMGLPLSSLAIEAPKSAPQETSCYKENLQKMTQPAQVKTDLRDSSTFGNRENACGFNQACKTATMQFTSAWNACIAKIPPNSPTAQQQRQICADQATVKGKAAGNLEEIKQRSLSMFAGSDMTDLQGKNCLWDSLSLNKLTAKQVEGLTPSQVKSLNPDQLEKMGNTLAKQGGGLTDAQQKLLGTDTNKAASWAKGVAAGDGKVDLTKYASSADATKVQNQLTQWKGSPPASTPVTKGPANAALNPPVGDSNIQVANINAAGAKENALTAANAQKSAAMMGAAAAIAAAVIPALLKSNGGNSGGSGGTTMSSNSGTQVKSEEIPGNSRVDITSSCVGVTAPTEAQIKACQGLGFRVVGGVIQPQPTITISNVNPNPSVNVLVPVGTGPSIEHMVAVQPGSSVDTTFGAGALVLSTTGAATTALLRSRNLMAEGSYIGDYRTGVMARYPSHSTADKPPLINWFSGQDVWVPEPWQQYQFQGLPRATVNFESGAANPPSSQTINVGILSSNLIKVNADINDARLDFHGDHSIVSTLLQNGTFRGSSMAVALSNIEVKALKRYLLYGKDGRNYILNGPDVIIEGPGAKVIQSSKGVPPEKLSPQQKELVYNP